MEGKGGAVYVESGGGIIAQSSYFKGNTALHQGGAIYFEGACHLEFSTFVGNKSEYGGAIYGTSGSVLTLDSNKFDFNVAAQSGPAVQLDAGALFDEKANSGCENIINVKYGLNLETAEHRTLPEPGEHCDGIYDVGIETCSTFGVVCNSGSNSNLRGKSSTG